MINADQLLSEPLALTISTYNVLVRYFKCTCSVALFLQARRENLDALGQKIKDEAPVSKASRKFSGSRNY